jgi:hypothetical protein
LQEAAKVTANMLCGRQEDGKSKSRKVSGIGCEFVMFPLCMFLLRRELADSLIKLEFNNEVVNGLVNFKLTSFLLLTF